MRALLTVLALSAVLVLGVMVHAARGGPALSGVGETLASMLFVSWDLGAFVLAGVVVVLVLPRVPGATLAIALGTVALSVTAVLGVVAFLTSESSTAPLIFVWLPVYQVVAALGAAALGGVLDLLRHLWVLRRSPAGATSPARRGWSASTAPPNRSPTP